jgi:hypothetical protein
MKTIVLLFGIVILPVHKVLAQTPPSYRDPTAWIYLTNSSNGFDYYLDTTHIKDSAGLRSILSMSVPNDSAMAAVRSSNGYWASYHHTVNYYTVRLADTSMKGAQMIIYNASDLEITHAPSPDSVWSKGNIGSSWDVISKAAVGWRRLSK